MKKAYISLIFICLIPAAGLSYLVSETLMKGAPLSLNLPASVPLVSFNSN